MSELDQPLAVIYHANCLDGKASAAVVAKKYGPIEEYPWTYGRRRPPSMLGKRVFILDCCLPAEDMRAIEREACELTWLDHHETAIPTQQELNWGTIDTSMCGATLTWTHLFPDEPMPAILNHIQDKDLWLWSDPASKPITMALEDEYLQSSIDSLWDHDLTALASRGDELLAKQTAEVEKICKRGVITRDPYGLLGKTALVINNAQHINDVGDKACREGHNGQAIDLVIQFVMRNDGRWVHSLRSAQLDLRSLAENRGGGGHQRAAAYISDMPFPSSTDCLDWPI